MNGFIQVITTTSSKEQAISIAEALVAQRLAGCVQVGGPIMSVYRWQGKIETAEEWTCTAKSRADLYSRIEAEIARLHAYDTPEILAVPIQTGSAKYLDWLTSELAATDG